MHTTIQIKSLYSDAKQIVCFITTKQEYFIIKYQLTESQLKNVYALYKYSVL